MLIAGPRGPYRAVRPRGDGDRDRRRVRPAGGVCDRVAEGSGREVVVVDDAMDDLFIEFRLKAGGRQFFFDQLRMQGK